MKVINEVMLVDVDKLRPYERNARTHTDAQVEKVRASIRECGFLNPVIIDRDYTVIAGCCRLLAAKAEGLRQIPCVPAWHLTEAQKRAYVLADNRLALDAGWDEQMVREELAWLQAAAFDVALTGFEPAELRELLPDETSEDDFDAEAAAAEIAAAGAKTRLGDVWKLGEHLLLCGDATKVEDVRTLMGGEQATVCVTDPPYNMAYEGAGGSRRSDRILNDKMPEADFAAFLRAFYGALSEALQDGASFYVFYKELGRGVFLTALQESGLTFKQELVWVKSQLVLGGGKYQNMYEPCLFGCKGKSARFWYGGRKQRSVIESADLMDEFELRAALKALLCELDGDVLREKKPQKNDLHPTMKPVKLLAQLIGNSSSRSDAVLDLFGGSGSTLIACEQLGRRCRMMELSPVYCDVIVARWEALTGQTARRL